MSGLEDIGAILGRALGGSAPDARLAAVCSAWRAAACTSAVLAGDLTMRSPELLARLREQACELPALRFRVGPVPGSAGG